MADASDVNRAALLLSQGWTVEQIESAGKIARDALSVVQETHTQDFEVRRFYSSSMSGCYGAFTVALETGTWGSVPIEDIVGRFIGDRAKIRVSVTVLEEGEPSGKNPWHTGRAQFKCPCNETGGSEQ